MDLNKRRSRAVEYLVWGLVSRVWADGYWLARAVRRNWSGFLEAESRSSQFRSGRSSKGKARWDLRDSRKNVNGYARKD